MIIGKSIKIQRRDFMLLAGVSFLGFANSTLFLYGLELTTASNAGVITATIPLFILIVAFFSGIERPTFSMVLGILVGFTGTLILTWQERTLTACRGDIIVLCACALMAMFTADNRFDGDYYRYCSDKEKGV